MRPKQFELIVDALKSLPGVGTKQAEKIAYFIAEKSDFYVDELLTKIKSFKDGIVFCPSCNYFLTNGLCIFCDNNLRNKHKLCIVTTIDDLEKIHKTGEYDGLYFVLNEEVDIKKKVPISENKINQLINTIKNNATTEIIFATNSTLNGEATSLSLRKIIDDYNIPTSFYRLAIGLPINSQLNYADEKTLKNAISNKVKY